MNKILLTLLLMFAAPLKADILEDFDSLGGNDVLLDQAKALNPQIKTNIVQQRTVNRFKRFEFTPEYSLVAGGNSYLNTSNTGLVAQYHLNPHWSFGARHQYYFNELTQDGKQAVIDAERISKETGRDFALIPELNWLKSSTSAFINFYPIYGKLNFFDKGVVHFDVYATLGYGQAELRNNSSSIYNGGLGFGMWISQHLTSRIEYNYHTYSSEFFNETKDIGIHSFSLGLGYLL